MDEYVYRIMKIEHVLALFSKRTNVLVSPWKWEDPFENFVLTSSVVIDGEPGSFSFHNDFFGQCWTLHKSSDAMWRIYSPDKCGIRLRTTIRKLYKSLCDAGGGSESPYAHIGKVRYLRQSELLNFCKQGVELTSDGGGVADTLLVKRLAFAHEREVRLLRFNETPVSKKTVLHSYSIDPHSLVDQMMLDPRLSVKEATTFKKRLRRCTAFKGEIKRLLLYAPPKGFITTVR